MARPLELLYTPTGGATQRYWYVLDGKGNVVALTTASGAVVDRYAYDVWGVPTIDREQVPQPLLYGGYVYDRELSGPGDVTASGQPVGWYWLSVRHYDPSLKRFLQPDPSEREDTRSYVYCNDDPLDCADPTGLSSGDCINLGFFNACFGGGTTGAPSVQYHTPAQRVGHQVQQGMETLAQDAYQLTIGGTVSDMGTLAESECESPTTRVGLPSAFCCRWFWGPEAGVEADALATADDRDSSREWR